MKLCSIGLSQSRTVVVSGLPHNDAAVYTGTALRGSMAPHSGTAAVLLVVVISVVFGSKPVGNLGDLETGVLAPERNKHQPDEIRITGYGAGYGGWRTIVYSLLFIDGGCRRSRLGWSTARIRWGSRSVGSWPTAGCHECGRWWHPAWIRRIRRLCWLWWMQR